MQAFTFLLGGYETTASSLAFAVYLLSANPDKAARLAQARALVDPAFLCRTATARDIPRLPTCTQVPHTRCA